MNTKYTIFNTKKKIILNYPKSAAMGFFCKGPKNEFETAVVNEPSVFEALKFYCNVKTYSGNDFDSFFFFFGQLHDT